VTRSEIEAQMMGFQASTVILAANRLGLLGALCGGPSTSDELAARLKLDARATTTVCDALVSLGVIERRGTELQVAETLRAVLDPGSPSSLVRIMEHEWHLLQRWVKLDEVMRSGRPVPRSRDDEPGRRAFIFGMADLARRNSAALWEQIDLTGFGHLVDVGGGPGQFALAALARFPGLRATVFDLPAVLPLTREYAAETAADPRLGFEAGDILEQDIPPCDVALVFSLVHSFGAPEVERLARHVAAGVKPGGLLLIREFMWRSAAHDGPPSTALFAVNMLIGTTAGRCWGAEELEGIFGSAGFGSWRRLELDARSTVLIGTRSED
jgi:3-hydroxy-5-methyl-1-naphthoate 3-O-methyltransferase